MIHNFVAAEVVAGGCNEDPLEDADEDSDGVIALEGVTEVIEVIDTGTILDASGLAEKLCWT